MELVGMRKVVCHRYTEYGKVAFQTYIMLLRQELFQHIIFDCIEMFWRKSKAGKPRRAVAFVKHSVIGVGTSLTIFLKPHESTWIVDFVDLKTDEGVTRFHPISGGWKEEKVASEAA